LLGNLSARHALGWIYQGHDRNLDLARYKSIQQSRRIAKPAPDTNARVFAHKGSDHWHRKGRGGKADREAATAEIAKGVYGTFQFMHAAEHEPSTNEHIASGFGQGKPGATIQQESAAISFKSCQVD
jgi:hypothetical protein